MSAHRVRIVLSDEAEDDLESVALYGLALWGADLAHRYYAKVRDALDSLGHFPQLGRHFDDAMATTRVLPVGEHVIYYAVGAERVTVLRILHARMSPKGHLDRWIPEQ